MSNTKAYMTKYDLGINGSRSIQGHNLNNLGSTRIDNATNQISRSSVNWFWRRRFLRFLPYMGMAAILVMWPRPFEQIFIPPTPGGYIWNLVTIGPVVSEEKSFEIEDGGRRTTEPAYTISIPGAFGSGELKILAVGRGWGVARVSDFFFIFRKNPSLNFFFFLRGWR